MSTPTEKIRAGLDKLQNSAGTVPISNLYGAPASLSQLQAAVEKIASARDRLAKLAAVTVAAVAKSREETEARYAELGKIREGRLVTDQLGDVRRKAMIDREHAKASREIRKKSSEERNKLAAEVRDIKSKLDSVRDAWGHPVTVLDRRTRLDPNRAILTQTLAGANVAAITHAIRDGITSRNPALAMAALGAAEKLPKETRKLLPFTARDVAEAIPEVKREADVANWLVANAEVLAVESELAVAQAEGSRDASRLAMRVGILKREAESLTGNSDNASESDDDPNVIDTPEKLEAYLRANPAAPEPDRAA